jgi:hypothetical protein
VRAEEQHRREMPEGVGVKVDPRLLGDRALDLLCELRRRLRAALARREQKAIGILGQHRPTASEIDVEERVERIGDLKGEGRPVLHLLGRNDYVTNASRPGTNNMSAKMKRSQVLHPHRRD